MPEDKEMHPFPQFDPVPDTESFVDLKQTYQTKNHRIFKRAVAEREVGEGEIVFSVVGGVKKLHVKLDGILISAVLT